MALSRRGRDRRRHAAGGWETDGLAQDPPNRRGAASHLLHVSPRCRSVARPPAGKSMSETTQRSAPAASIRYSNSSSLSQSAKCAAATPRLLRWLRRPHRIPVLFSNISLRRRGRRGYGAATRRRFYLHRFHALEKIQHTRHAQSVIHQRPALLVREDSRLL